MANTVDASGRRVFDDAYTFPQDTQALADDIFAGDNARVGSSSDRQSLPAAKQRFGMLWTETDTGFTFVNRGAGIWTLIAGPMPYLVARSTTQQALTNSQWATLTNWDTPTTIRGITFNVTNGLITIDRSGVYELDGFVSEVAGGSVGNRVARFTKNGITDTDALAYGIEVTNGIAALPVRRTLSLAQGDVIRFQALQASGGSLNTIVSNNGYETRLSIRFIAES